MERARPTLVVSEAVLFYLSPKAKEALLQDAGDFVRGCPGSSRLVLTDNLGPFVSGPARETAAEFLSPLGLRLQDHETLWGGAIQFIRAESTAVEEEAA